MRYFAKKHGEDVEFWGAVGLLHDLDYEKYPDKHCQMSAQILRENSYSEEFVHAVVSHGWKICSDVEPTHVMEKILYTTDELTGLITATALMRPSKSILDMEVKSVKNKWKDKRFAAGVNREVIEEGTKKLGIELPALIQDTIFGMREVAEQIGLKGTIVE